MTLQLSSSATQANHRAALGTNELTKVDGVEHPLRSCRDQQLLLRQCGYPPSLVGNEALPGRKRQRVIASRLRDMLEREQSQRPAVRPLARMRRQRSQSRDTTPAQTRRLQMDGVSRLGSPSLQRVDTPTDLDSWLHSALEQPQVKADAATAQTDSSVRPQVPSIRSLLQLATEPQVPDHVLHSAQLEAGDKKKVSVPPELSPTDSLTGASSQTSPASFDSMDESASMGALLRASVDPQRAQRLQACGAVPYLVEKMRETTNPQVATQIAATLVNLDPAIVPVPGLAHALGQKLPLLTSECSERLMVYTLGDDVQTALSRVEIDTLARQALAALPRHLVLLRRLAESSVGSAGSHATFWNDVSIQYIERLKPATPVHAEHVLAIMSTIPATRMQQKRAALANHVVMNIASRFPEHNGVQRAAVALLAKLAAA